jgi:hypothetical protein
MSNGGGSAADLARTRISTSRAPAEANFYQQLAKIVILQIPIWAGLVKTHVPEGCVRFLNGHCSNFSLITIEPRSHVAITIAKIVGLPHVSPNPSGLFSRKSCISRTYVDPAKENYATENPCFLHVCLFSKCDLVGC